MTYTSKSRITCTGSQMLNIDQGSCCSSCAPVDDKSSNQKLMIVSDVILFQHMSEGFHYVEFTNVTQIKVLPEDMLGWYSSNLTGKIAVVGEASNDRGQVYEGIMDGGIAGETFGPGLPSTAYNLTFALSANVVPLSIYKASFNFEQTARHKVSVRLRDNFGNMETSSEDIFYQQTIWGVNLTAPAFALLGDVSLGLSVSNGTNVSYIIDSGDGQVKEVFNETSVTFNYTSKGVHHVKLLAFNDVSAATSQCRGPYILAEIENLTILYVPPVVPNVSFAITISLLQGNLVDLNVSLGNESTWFNVTKFDVNGTFVVVRNHSYKSPGVFRVTAFATNNLSNASAERSITVQLPITGLNASAPQTIHSSEDDLVINMSVTQGTEVQYDVTLYNHQYDPTAKTANGHFATVVFPKDILRSGLFQLKVKAYNLVSSNESITNISIVTPISGARLELVSSSKAIGAGKPVTFGFIYERGSNILAMTFLQSRTAKATPIGLRTANLLFHFEGVKYSNPGIYIARVNYSNLLGSVVIERTVIVQQSVENIEIVADSPRPFPPGVVNVTVNQNGPIATNATLLCSYGDGTSSEGLDFTGEFNISHRCL